jgi:hypothetical protein
MLRYHIPGNILLKCGFPLVYQRFIDLKRKVVEVMGRNSRNRGKGNRGKISEYS